MSPTPLALRFASVELRGWGWARRLGFEDLTREARSLRQKISTVKRSSENSGLVSRKGSFFMGLAGLNSRQPVEVQMGSLTSSSAEMSKQREVRFLFKRPHLQWSASEMLQSQQST